MVRFVQDVESAETTAGSAAGGQGAIGKAWLGGCAVPEHGVKRWPRRQKVAKSPAAAARRSCAAALNMTMAGADVLWIDVEHVVGVERVG